MDRRLLAFTTIARHGGFGSAARSLNLTQPSLTKQIHSLERELGGRLFTRGRHGAALTGFGRALLPQAQDLLAEADGFQRRARLLATGENGSLALGFGMSSIEVAPRAVAAFRRRYPRVETSLEDLPSTELLDRVRGGDLHAAFVRMPAGTGLREEVLCHDRLAVAALGHAPAEAGWLAAQHLVRLAERKGPGLAGQIDRLCTAWQVRPGTAQVTHDLQTVLALVAAGVGPALVPASAAAIAPASVSLTPIAHPAAAWDVGLVTSPAHEAAVTTNFLEVVRGLDY